ncbi:hypothetical protein JW835_12625 [bacterium]|nr:hypothetical protein [bacterium]
MLKYKNIATVCSVILVNLSLSAHLNSQTYCIRSSVISCGGIHKTSLNYQSSNSLGVTAAIGLSQDPSTTLLAGFQETCILLLTTSFHESGYQIGDNMPTEFRPEFSKSF